MTDLEQDPIDTAWRVHEAVCDWTGKVDVKASFALSIESAVLIAIFAIATGKHRLGHLHGSPQYLFWFGIAGIVLGVLFAVGAVIPHLDRRSIRKNWKAGFIYFGHLKEWSRHEETSDLETALREMEILPMLATQVKSMGKIAWRKHVYLQGSFAAAVAGCLLVASAAAIA